MNELSHSERMLLNSVSASHPPQRDRKLSVWAISYGGIAPLFAAADAVLIVLSSLIGGVAYQFASGNHPQDYDIFLGIGVMASIAYALAAWNFDLYNVVGIQKLSRDSWRIFCGWAFIILVITLLLFLLKIGASVSRGSVISFFALSLGTLLTWRLIAKRLVRRALGTGTIYGRRGMLVGTRDEVMAISDELLLLTYGVDEIDRVIVPSRDRDSIGSSKLEVAAIASALEKAREADAEEIILALSWGNSAQLDLVREQLRVSPLPVRLVPDRYIREILEPSAGRAQLIDIQRGPLTRTEQATKRLFDIVLAGGILVMLAPLMMLTALIVKLDSPGPVIFRQRRKGFNGREFLIYKFRTMTVQEDGAVVQQARKDDGRLTSVGHLLRRYSIDELPQFINVLLGDMSLVGPRPHAVAHDDEYGGLIANYAFRHHVKPGITGWAQVNGLRGPTPQVEHMNRRIEFDLWYINHWSVWFDLQIVAKTAFELGRGRNAY